MPWTAPRWLARRKRNTSGEPFFVRNAAYRRLDSIFLMATAQLYTQGKLALGRPIAHTPVTRK